MRALTFVLAAGLGSLVALTRLALQPALGSTLPLIMALPGMILAALIGGFWPTIVVAAVGFAVGLWALEGDVTAVHPMTIPVYSAFALIFAVAGAARRRWRARAEAHAQHLAELQRKMVQVARLNAVGEMAGSLAHELNQPLTAIANYLNAAQQLMARDEVPAARVSELMRKAGDQAIRASQIVGRVRTGLDSGALTAGEESAASMVQEAVDVARAATASDGLAIRYDFDRTADRVLGDRGQVQQVILNLVRNSVEAMAACPLRELKISSRAADSGFVQLSVADTGPGVSPEVADRLFQPFVTGKADGMGVGLSISRSIVERHGGRMWMESNAEGGATFHFTLRRWGGEAGHAA
ncbi:MAG TPA: ATP-binding protein [Phenylobacterium sp.]